MERRRLDDLSVYSPEFTLGYFRNTFLQFLQISFASEFAPPEYRYHESEDQSLIKIEAASAERLKTVDDRPKIVVARGGFRWHNKSGIGHLHQASQLSESHGHQIKHISDIISGTIRISTVSREDIESEILANHVLFLIRRFKQAIAKYGLLSIQEFSVSPTAMIKGQDGGVTGFVTSVDVAVLAQDTWLITNDSKVLVNKIQTLICT